ncbi:MULTISPECIES: FtsX-like permease family protein [Asticcacaulis]|uniref:FtsX-like permease family protein n=1 Tax=Asticcacaulis TaxID=76890 RepID=UPI001AE3DCF9|nr:MULTISPECIES: ABC transporter permease [Asticcacaulis]MBP2160309.1 putative ABC transport system permease protein [Asticcacaulis solisilvae]MDR6801388.1 putative ABC transport system permease protein [Asticcacaulis sp. BE141]
MIRLRFVLQGLLRRWGSTCLTIGVGALSIAGLCLIFWAQSAIPEAVKTRISETDMVVGPKSSGLDLALCCALQMTPAQGLLELERVQARLAMDDVRPFVRMQVPVAMGDSYRGHRIVWTTPDIAPFYGARLTDGRTWRQPLEIVAGSEAARSLKLKPGVRLTSSHGLAADGDAHDAAYTVTGILAPTGGVLDHLLLADLASIARVHDHGGEHDHTETAPHSRVNAVLVRFTSEIAQASLPVLISDSETLSAASPRLELAKLMALARPLIDGATIVSAIFGALAVMILGLSLMQGLNRRARDFMLLRFLGMSRRDLALLSIGESLLITHLALLGGCILAVAGQSVLAGMLASHGLTVSGAVPFREALTLYSAAVVLSVLSALGPTLRMSIARDDEELRA